jgi:hypothetical protein
LTDDAVALFRALVARVGPGFENEPLVLIAQFSVALWTDFLAFVPLETLGEYRDVVNAIMEGINTQRDPGLRTLYLWGIGKVLERFPLGAEELDQVLGAIYGAIVAQQAEKDFAGNDSGLSSYARLLKRRVALPAPDDAIEKFFQLFPARVDADEAAIAYEMLVGMLKGAEFAAYYEAIVAVLAAGLEVDEIGDVVRKVVGTAIEAFGHAIPPQFAVLLE